MQQILIDSHREHVQNIAERLPQDVEFYSKTMSVQAGLQTAINNRTISNLVLWVRRPDGKIAAQSPSLRQNNGTNAALLSLSGKVVKTQVYQVNGRYLMLYGRPLLVQGTVIGTLYIAQDVTRDQTMFLALVRSLSIATILAILALMLVISVYVQRSLQPLRQMSQLAGTVSLDDLGQAQLNLERAPSEVQELSRTFNLMLSRLSAAWEQQRQFVSDISHELRTPLTVVQGYLQSLVRRGVNLTELQREALEVAISETERTVHLLQELLDLARVESDYPYFRFETFHLNDLVAEVTGMAEQFSSRPITIEAGPFPIEVRADRNSLRRVLINLLDNAMKYSDPGTPITVKLEQTAGTAIIHVRDRGYGIPLQQQARIFERFYRADEARAHSTSGSGLGLAIVKTLVEGMGGSVTVRSQLDEGSTFTVTLPARATV
jgi:signal transduction histidine kinase